MVAWEKNRKKQKQTTERAMKKIMTVLMPGALILSPGCGSSSNSTSANKETDTTSEICSQDEHHAEEEHHDEDHH